jgi:hypothetical protein
LITLIFVIIIIFITIVTTQMLQIASFLYFEYVPFTHAHLVIGPRATELAELNCYYYFLQFIYYFYIILFPRIPNYLN